MKTISQINWIIIAIYSIYAIIIYIDSNRSGMDAAGRGMAMGFLIVGIFYLFILIVLNLINYKWVKILVLIMGGLPLCYFVTQSILTYQTHKKYDKLRKDNSKFKDSHLNDIMGAILRNDLDHVKRLISKNSSLINHIGENNRKTILDIAVRNSWMRENQTANDIVLAILEKGADPNIFHPDSYGTYAPLAAYGQYLDISIFESLLKAGANPFAIGEQSTPLIYTLIENDRNDSFQKVKLLLEYGLDPNIPLGDDQPYKLNYSPLIWAANSEKWAICELLINSGANINFEPKGPDGRSFKFILDGKSKDYQQAGVTPDSYASLMSNEKIKQLYKSN